MNKKTEKKPTEINNEKFRTFEKKPLLKKSHLQTTLFLVREIINLMNSNNKKNSIDAFYKYLDITQKDYQSFLQSDSNQISLNIIENVIARLVSCGFNYDLLLIGITDNAYLEMSDELDDATATYISSLAPNRSDDGILDFQIKEYFPLIEPIPEHLQGDIPDEDFDIKKTYPSILRKELDTIYNPDGSLFVDDVYALYQRIYSHPVLQEATSVFIEDNKTQKYPQSYSPKDVAELIANDYKEFTDITLKNNKASIKYKKINCTPEEKLFINFLLIRETYLQLAALDKNNTKVYLDAFYQFLNIEPFASDINITADVLKEIKQKLSPLGFSDKLFRKDSPTLYPVGNYIIQILEDYLKSQSSNLNQLRNKLKIELLYMGDPLNTPLVYSTYKLYQEIKRKYFLI